MDRKYRIAGLLSILLVSGLALTIVTNAYAPVLQQYGLQVDAANEITQETSQADYAMRQYEWFQQQREDIDSMQRKIENQRQQVKDFKDVNDMDDLSYQEQRQYNRMTNRLLGYQNQYETYVADYNARMNVSYQEQYSDELPLEMEDKFWQGDLIP
jgi:Skp family chaperone for outer membrane proteins